MKLLENEADVLKPEIGQFPTLQVMNRLVTVR